MYYAKFKTKEAALSFYERQHEQGISAGYPQYDKYAEFPWSVYTIET